MTLLVDNQLPLALARYLAANGWECIHVQDVGLEAAEDRTIWQYAKERSLTIITKDEDFQALANRQRSIPPQVSGFASAIVGRRYYWKHFREYCLSCVVSWPSAML